MPRKNERREDKAAAGTTKLGRSRLLAAFSAYGNGFTADTPIVGVDFLEELLKEHHTVDPGRIAAIGYCFGGGVVLAMAREGIELKGVVSFHGSLATDQPAQPGAIKARVLVLNSEDDSMVTKEEIESFRQEMTAAGADYQLISYPGALHGFTNPEADALGRQFDLPLAYDPAADRQSWKAMEDFFTEIFSSPAPN